jgi:hypothetical protein
MAMSIPEFRARCQFYMRGTRLHGRCTIRLPDGRLLQVSTNNDEGVDLSNLTHAFAKQDAAVSGMWGDAWSAAKGAAKKAASSRVAKTLYRKSRQATSRAVSLARSPAGQAALSFVPGGASVGLGMRAANLIEQATVKKNPAALMKIAKVAALAQRGDPSAIQAHAILQSIFKLGKKKGAWQSCPPCPNTASVQGWWYNKPYRSLAFDTPSVKLRALYSLGMR